MIDDKLIQGAEEIVLEGGHLDQALTAKKVSIRGNDDSVIDYSNIAITGDDVNIRGGFLAKAIIARALRVNDAVLPCPVRVSGDADLFNSITQGTLYCGRNT